MKNKQDNWNVNSQEDEDGFNLNPYDAFIDEWTNGKQDDNAIRNNTNSASDSLEDIIIASEEKRETNQVTFF